jgi:cathepsin C
MTKNTVAPILSPQDVVDCSPYAYGCYGGWIYPEGRYAEEFGFIEEACSSYNAEESPRCTRDKNCIKYYATNYQYVGGYFGASNEYVLMNTILNNGPVVVGYAIYHDFIYYRSGIYYHSGPDWLLGYHAVSIVGWGKDDRSGTKYWIVKNSWGSNWGEEGFFRIIRGSNDCDIEGEAFEAFPII